MSVNPTLHLVTRFIVATLAATITVAVLTFVTELFQDNGGHIENAVVAQLELAPHRTAVSHLAIGPT